MLPSDGGEQRQRVRAKRGAMTSAAPTPSFAEASGLFDRIAATNVQPRFPQLSDVVFAGAVAHK
jgi:hypothetical protein